VRIAIGRESVLPFVACARGVGVCALRTRLVALVPRTTSGGKRSVRQVQLAHARSRTGTAPVGIALTFPRHGLRLLRSLGRLEVRVVVDATARGRTQRLEQSVVLVARRGGGIERASLRTRVPRAELARGRSSTASTG
jgi:hypothetical protein